MQTGTASRTIGALTEPSNVDVYAATSAPSYSLGLGFNDRFGRRFRYAKAGGVALVQAKMTQSAVTAAAYYTAIPQTAYPQTAGNRNIRVLVATGGLAAGAADDDFAGGWLMCNKVSPAVVGDIYAILASKQTAETLVDLELASPIRNAWLATGELTLTYSKFFKTLVFAAYDATAQAAGVPLCPVAIGYYYWAQVKGPAPLIVDGSETLDIGQSVGCPITLASPGMAGAHITTTAEVLRRPWGTCMEVAVDGEPALVDLCLE